MFECDNIRSEITANLIIESLKSNGIDISYCRSQTYGEQLKISKKNSQNDRALYYHCASHELNLALTKASRVPEVFNMVCLLQSLGRFFASSPKRQRLFEKVIQEKVDQSTFNKMKKKIKLFCETRWVERHTEFEDLDVLYLYIILCLEITSENEDRNWNLKSVLESGGLLGQLMESKFFVAFQGCCYLLGFTKSTSMLLQGSDIEISCSYEMITNVQAAFEDV